MANFLENELIITLNKCEYDELFELNQNIPHLLFDEDTRKVKKDDEYRRKGKNNSLIDTLKELFDGGDKYDTFTMPECLCNRVYIPNAYASRHKDSDPILQKLRMDLGVEFAPIYDFKIECSTTHPSVENPPLLQGLDFREMSKWLGNDEEELCHLFTEDNGKKLYHTLILNKDLGEMHSGRARTYRIRFTENVDVNELRNREFDDIEYIDKNYLFTMSASKWEKSIGLLDLEMNSNRQSKFRTYPHIEPTIGPPRQATNLQGSAANENGPAEKESGTQAASPSKNHVVVAIVDSGIKLKGEPPDGLMPPEKLTENIKLPELKERLPKNIQTLFGGEVEKQIFLDVVRYDPRLKDKKGKGRKFGRLMPTGDGTVADNWPHDEIGHGTDLARIIARGMGEDGAFLPIRAFYKSRLAPGGTASTTDICAGVDVAIQAKADVINLSFSIDTEVRMLKELIMSTKKYPGNHRPCFIVALGNDNNNCKAWPAAYAGEVYDFPILGVGGARITADGSIERGGNTNYGKKDYGDYVLGPASGVDVRYEGGEGTSYATAYVSGLAARIISVFKSCDFSWTPEIVYEIIRTSCEKQGIMDEDKNKWFCCGLVNFNEAVNKAQEKCEKNSINA